MRNFYPEVSEQISKPLGLDDVKKIYEIISIYSNNQMAQDFYRFFMEFQVLMDMDITVHNLVSQTDLWFLTVLHEYLHPLHDLSEIERGEDGMYTNEQIIQIKLIVNDWHKRNYQNLYYKIGTTARLAGALGNKEAQYLCDNHPTLNLLLSEHTSNVEFILGTITEVFELYEKINVFKHVEYTMNIEPHVYLPTTQYKIKYTIVTDGGISLFLTLYKYHAQKDFYQVIKEYEVSILEFKHAIPELVIDIIRDQMFDVPEYRKFIDDK